mmetsp:Transcript_7276/g.14378  ORF Transcript_7276/g.14378 Transcript_7276/m.14378 type:complete len:662 (-) Transcript_7276:1933-3918(-)|eukprot:CAMPEP_0178695098 /NCGR_PEP_ID=MMETSP0699-20121125/8658_1 /TAXON_ID=265572 /ORGANISM="Extubocellulus spinifer, Strain CCMP396" /LENGTH=661 /DNA_ID=CAMNT_0020340741 /DNA_START=2034 /DNA_END=4019 /DNA_ORIENTATION=+
MNNELNEQSAAAATASAAENGSGHENNSGRGGHPSKDELLDAVDRIFGRLTEDDKDTMTVGQVIKDIEESNNTKLIRGARRAVRDRLLELCTGTGNLHRPTGITEDATSSNAPSDVDDDRSITSDVSMVSLMSSLTMRSDDTNDGEYYPSRRNGQQEGEEFDDDIPLYYDDDDDVCDTEKIEPNLLHGLIVQALRVPMGFQHMRPLWDPILPRLMEHPEEAYGAFRTERRSDPPYPSILHFILLHELERPALERTLPDGLIAALVNANPDACGIQPYPLHILVEILIQKRIPFCSKNDVTAILDAYPNALCHSSTVDAGLIRGRQPPSTGWMPLQRIAGLGDHLRPPRAPLSNFRQCLEICRHLVHEIRCWQPLLFTWKADPESYRGTPLDSFNSLVCFDLDVIVKNGIWSVFMEYLRCTCEAQFFLEDGHVSVDDDDRLGVVDPLLFFTAFELYVSGCLIQKVVELMPDVAAQCRHPITGYSPLLYACRTSVVAEARAGPYVSNETILLLAETDPTLLRLADANGRLPLHLALEQDRELDTIQRLVELEPRALKTSDALTGLYPFMTAAVGDKSRHPTNKGEWQLDIVYSLLRKEPMLASGLASDTPWQRAEKMFEQRIGEVETERDEYKDEAQTLKAENEALKAKVAALEATQGNMSTF